MDNSAGQSPYRPLSPSDPSEIRLVKLFAGDFDDDVRCELLHVSLQSTEGCPTFAALSYTWGDQNLTKPLELNGCRYPVTTNLLAFLRHAQAILLAIVEHLPRELRKPGCLHEFLFSILKEESANFPSDFPPDPSAMSELVRRHILNVVTVCLDGADSATIDDAIKSLDIDSGPQTPPRECFVHFWIDALCINQKDSNEKSRQVSRMRDIYSRAPALLIWFGEAIASDPTISDAVDLIRDIDKVKRSDTFTPAAAIEYLTSESFIRPRVHGVFQVCQIMTNSWFSRIWIIQEVATASGSATALLGFQPIDWEFLTTVVFRVCEMMAIYSGLNGLPMIFNGNMANMRTIRDITREYQNIIKSQDERSSTTWRADNTPSRLNELLRDTCSKFNATDPRDLLYALLGLLGPAGIPPDISPDYSKPTEQIFHEYAVYLARHTQSLDFLTFRQRDLPNVPTWVPHWGFVDMEKRDSSGTTVPSSSGSLAISVDGLQLNVNGTVLGHVLAVVFPTESGDDVDFRIFVIHDTESAAQEEVEGIARSVEQGFFGMQRLKAMCLLSCASFSTPGFLDPSDFDREWDRFWGLREHFQSQWSALEGKEEVQLETFMGRDSSRLFAGLAHLISSFAKTGLAILDGARLVTTLRVDEAIREGDVICLLDGMGTPCILRRKEELGYTFVGVTRQTSLDVSQQAYANYPVERFTLV